MVPTSPKPAADAHAEGGAEGGQWLVAKAERGGKVHFIRLRTDLAPYVGTSHPHRIEINWPFVGEPTGLPDTPTLAALEAFEDRLGPLEVGDAAMLAIVVTGAGERRWTFHAKDRERTMSALRPLLPKTPAVTVEAFDDPTWSTYSELIAAAKRN